MSVMGQSKQANNFLHAETEGKKKKKRTNSQSLDKDAFTPVLGDMQPTGHRLGMLGH